MILSKATTENELKRLWLIVVIMAALVGAMGWIVVVAKHDIQQNDSELDRRGVWMESIDGKMLDRFTASDFEEFLKANPELVDPRK